MPAAGSWALGAHCGGGGVTVLTNRHSPAEIARKKSKKVGVGCAPVSPTPAAGLPLAVAEQDHQLRGAKKIERKCCLLVTCRHTRKKTGRGAYWLGFKRANNSCFGSSDRAAGRQWKWEWEPSGE
jgi:hypothetical protein